MATYHLSLKSGKVGNGKTHAEYILREGKYAGSQKAEELVFKSANLPHWCSSAIDFFEKTDIYERINGSAYKEFEIALPNELSHEENQKLVEEFIKNHIGNNKVWAYAIHTKPATFASDQEQIHAHIMFCERIVENGMEKAKGPSTFFKRYNAKNPSKGGYQKDRSLADYKVRSKNVISIRQSWENQINKAYKEKGINERVSCKTISAQRQAAEKIGDMVLAEFFDREPQEHLGPTLSYKTRKLLLEKGIDQENIDNSLDALYNMSPKAFVVIVEKIQKENKKQKMLYKRQLELERMVKEKGLQIRESINQMSWNNNVVAKYIKHLIKDDNYTTYIALIGKLQSLKDEQNKLINARSIANDLRKEFENMAKPRWWQLKYKEKYALARNKVENTIQWLNQAEMEYSSHCQDLADIFHLDYRELIYQNALKNDKFLDVIFNFVKYTINGTKNGTNVRMKLKNYLRTDDIRWKTMTTKEAKDLVEAFKGKINLHQQAYYKKHGIEYNENTTYEEAKVVIDNGKPTEKQLKYAATFMPAETLENLTNKDLNEAIKAHRQVVSEEGKKEVTNSIFRHAQECGLVKEGETYTNAQWAEDSKTCKPIPALEAYVEYHQLHNDVKYFMDKYPEQYPEKSQALYAMVQQRHEKKMVEKQNAPMDPYQEKFLNNHQISTEGITKWQEAQYLICDRLYKERLVGYQDACMLATNPEIKVPDSYLKAVSNREVLSKEEKESIAKAVNAECNKVRVAERTYRIEIASIPRQNSLTDMARLACKEHLAANNGSYKGAEKAMADILVTSNFTISDYEKENFFKSHKELKDISEVTNAHIIAHNIACVLPDCVGMYSEQFPKILNVVQKSEIAMEKVKLKEAFKEQGRQQGLFEHKKRTTDIEM